MRIAPRVVALAMLLSASARVSHAQIAVQGALDVGLARARQVAPPPQAAPHELQAGVVALTGQVAGRALVLTGQALVTGAADSAGAAQARLHLLGRAPRASWLTVEGSLATTAFGLGPSGVPNSRLGGSSAGGLRLGAEVDRIVRGAIGIGYDESRLRRITEIPLPRTGVERRSEGYRGSAIDVAAWTAVGPVRVDAGARRIRTNDYPLLEPSGYSLLRHASAYDLRDVSVAATLTYGRLDASAHNVWRRGIVATRGQGEALGYAASLRLTRTLALHASHGQQLADPLHGIPQARVSTLALRVLFGGTPRVPSVRARADGELVIEPAPGDTVRRVLVLRVRAADASTVDAAGTWNDWAPVPLSRDGDTWVARIPLPSGAHRIALRENGGPWRAPRGTAKAVDEFGVESGMVIVP